MTRSWQLMMAGASAVAVIFLFQLEGNNGQRAGSMSGPDLLARLPSMVGSLNGRPISRKEVAAELEGTPNPTRNEIRAAVRRLIDARLLAEATALMNGGQESAIPMPVKPLHDPLARQALVWPDEIESFWSRHRPVFSEDLFHVRRMTRATEHEAREARQIFFAPASAGVQLPEAEWLGPSQLEQEVERALRRMQPGEISEVVPVDGRYDVLQLIERKTSSDASLAEWGPRLTEYLQAERWFRERTRWLRIREAYAALEVAPELEFPQTARAVEFFRTHPNIVAVVNGNQITEEQLAAQVLQRRAMAGTSSRRLSNERELRPVLAGMVQNALVLEEARKLGLQVPDFELEQRFHALRSGFASDEAFDAMLRANATSRADWRRNMREGLLLLKTEYAVAARLPVEDAEIEAYWEQNKPGLARDRIKSRKLVFRTEHDARQAKESLDRGVPFEEVAKVVQGSVDDAALWTTHDMLPHEVWVAAWKTAPHTNVGPVRVKEEYWLLRVEARQEAGAQTSADHRDSIITILQRLHWRQRERARWILTLMDRATIWNRFDVAFKLNQTAPSIPGLPSGGRPVLLLVPSKRGCDARLCGSIETGWTRAVSLRIVPSSQVEQVSRAWGLPTLPWTFAIDERGIVVGEYPGPVTGAILDRLTSVLQQGARSARSTSISLNGEMPLAG